ncbi:MAG: MBL fold metallo-hydrolase, partial [Aliifodinibius sp.]|nr:MBL fold metallo-hydrolase [Fodinibius sp.]NIV14267.1 MBL fold metallo-hydrolase [Fodinibius sp.]NIY28102.1 MBL fold metallo-hydrolase [Fodinibius sp.]
MKIGNYEVHRVDAGRFRLDGGSMFGVVPKVLWEKQNPADEKNRILMSANLLLIQGKGRSILVDTGVGDKLDEKLAKIYAVDHSEHHLYQSLKQLNLSTRDITDVILTHLHFDHAGGATFRDSNGEVRPTFPNARYYLHKGQFDWAMQPSEKDQASYFHENYVPLQKHDQLVLLEDRQELFPGIEVIPVEGHTIGQQMVRVGGKDKCLLYAADLIPLASHVSIPWVMAFDLYPLTTIEEKKHYLKLAATEGWIIFFEHDPYLHCGTVKRTEKGY